MQRNESFSTMESVIAYIINGLNYYIESRGKVEIKDGKMFSYSVSMGSFWFRNSQLTLDRVYLAGNTILKLDKCDGNLETSLDVINAAIDSNAETEKAYRDRPYSTSLDRSMLHRLLLEAREILVRFQNENREHPAASPSLNLGVKAFVR